MIAHWKELGCGPQMGHMRSPVSFERGSPYWYKTWTAVGLRQCLRSGSSLSQCCRPARTIGAALENVRRALRTRTPAPTGLFTLLQPGAAAMAVDLRSTPPESRGANW